MQNKGNWKIKGNMMNKINAVKAAIRRKRQKITY